MELKQFYEKLAAAFVVSFTKSPKVIERMGVNIDDDLLQITIRKEKQGLIHCINGTVLEIRPDVNKKHHVLCQEILVGYDSEGYHWSDCMRGRLVDCTALNIDQAINLIVNKLKEIFKD